MKCKLRFPSSEVPTAQARLGNWDTRRLPRAIGKLPEIFGTLPIRKLRRQSIHPMQRANLMPRRGTLFSGECGQTNRHWPSWLKCTFIYPGNHRSFVTRWLMTQNPLEGDIKPATTIHTCRMIDTLSGWFKTGWHHFSILSIVIQMYLIRDGSNGHDKTLDLSHSDVTDISWWTWPYWPVLSKSCGEIW